MSTAIASLQPGGAAARTGEAAGGGTVKEGSAAGALVEPAQFQRLLERSDAGSASAKPPTVPGDEPHAVSATPDDSQCAQLLDELQDLLAMLPVAPWQVAGEPPGAPLASPPGASHGSLPAIAASPGGVAVLEDLPGGLAGFGSSPGLDPGGEARAAGLLEEAAQLPLAADLQHSGVSADALKQIAPPGVGGEPMQPQRGPQADVLSARAISQDVGSAAWADEIAARVNMMVEHGRHTVALRLSPEQLGPLEVRITLHEHQASVWFGAAHPDTRAALEAAMPRLREMFTAQGLALADTGVSEHSARQSPVPAAPAGRAGNPDAADAVAGLPLQARISLGLLDTYA